MFVFCFPNRNFLSETGEGRAGLEHIHPVLKNHVRLPYVTAHYVKDCKNKHMLTCIFYVERNSIYRKKKI